VSRTSTIYVLHFDPPYSVRIGGTDRTKTAGHYVGSCAGDVLERVEQHVTGRGSPLVRAAVRAGSTVLLAATLPGDKQAERRLKRTHHRERWCPFCTATPLTAAPEDRP
jgi:hypothetical protein